MAMKSVISTCSSQVVTANYVPPPLGNGDLSIQLDQEGMQRQRSYLSMIPGVYRAGRRYDSSGFELVPFGYFLQDTGILKNWSQSLDVTRASIQTDCDYEDGTSVLTEAFVHLNKPLLAIRKKFNGSLTFRYVLAQPGDEHRRPKRLSFWMNPTGNGVDILFLIDGLEKYRGIISFWTDASNPKIELRENEFSITAASNAGAVFYWSIHDSLDGSDPLGLAYELKREVAEKQYDGLFADHCAAWQKYWDQSYVVLPSKEEEMLYYTSQYHLRISSTRWSLPIGIFPTHWQGRYFSSDDHYSFMALLTSGHLEMAYRIPDFRFRTLQRAKDRAHRYFNRNESGARWNWEMLEDGAEGASEGFWLEHISHMANIALDCWYYFLFSDDRDFLREKGYPVISACAEFYQTQSVLEVSPGRYIVGKCTDFERLGPGRENAFMTTCGAIATFRAATMAAANLDIDHEKAKHWRFLADRLRDTLPLENDRYVPFPHCREKSISAFTGTFPYPVLPPDDPRQLAAIEDFTANEAAYGNMYPVGNSVCTWFLGLKGIALARLGLTDRACACIEQAAREAVNNCFHEVFEVCNPPLHPWFTTGEGAYIHLVNETLLQSDMGEIRMVDCGRENYAFKLSAIGGVMVETEVKSAQTVKLTIRTSVPYRGHIVLPDGQRMEIDLPAEATAVLI